MLIITHKHTKADLELWQDYESIDSVVKFSDAKVLQSIEVVLAWHQSHSDAVAYTSWGKDSVVLLDIIRRAGIIDIPVVFMRFGDRDNPDCLRVRDAYLATNKVNYYEEFFEYSKVRKTGSHWKTIAHKWGQHRLSGIRNDESGVRLLQWRLNGFTSEFSCRPLALWKSKDIFAYIHQNKLPLSPVYGYLGGGRWPRERLRTHSIGGTSGDGIGRTEWEKEYYPEIYRAVM